MESSLPETDGHEPKKPKKGNGENTGTDQDAAYLNTLVECEHQAIDQFDKTILALAGGAFAVSFAFLKDIVKPEQVTHKGWLISAWFFWSVALFCTLSSFYSSHLAMRHAQRKFKEGKRREKSLRGPFDTATLILNPSAGIAFIVGLISMSFFVTYNLNYERHPDSPPTASTNATAAATTAAAPSPPTAPATTNPAATTPAKSTGSP